MAATCSDEVFIETWQRLGSPSLVAEELGITLRGVLSRRTSLRNRTGVDLPTTLDMRCPTRNRMYEGRIDVELQDGAMIVFSDAHYWPGAASTAHRAVVAFCKAIKPKIVINNGDAFDGGTISRFPRIGWDDKPSVLDELRAVDDRLGEIEKAAKGARLIWNLGNHDARFETKLAQCAPEFQGVKGFHLKDHFPNWLPAWATWVNQDVVVKHRWHNGVHAAYNNTLKSGVSLVTGHLHRLKVEPFNDYNGRRWGVDTGTLADPYGPQFSDYTEVNPVNWNSGFVVLTFWKGRLLQPELVEVIDEGLVSFRGQVLEV